MHQLSIKPCRSIVNFHYNRLCTVDRQHHNLQQLSLCRQGALKRIMTTRNSNKCPMFLGSSNNLNSHLDDSTAHVSQTVSSEKTLILMETHKILTQFAIEWINVYTCSKTLMIKVKKKVKALFIYITDRKASAHSCRFFCSACFQLRSTTTGTLLLIRHPRRVSGRVDHRHLHIRMHLVVQGVRTLRQWYSWPKAGTIWRHAEF